MFSGNFIALTNEFNQKKSHISAPLFRKSFVLEKKIKSASLSICALGFYRLWINGNEITKGMFAPYISNPEQVQYYDEYNVKKYLRAGENVIAVMLGNGMQNEDIENWNFNKISFRSAPKFALSFALNGTQIFDATEGFKGYLSPITFDSLRMGEFYDARLEINGWKTTGFDDSTWFSPISAKDDGGEKRVCQAEPILPYKELKAIRIYKTKRNSYIYDFGENNAGIVRLTIRGVRGQQVDIHFGEIASQEGLEERHLSIHYPDIKDGYFQHLRYTLKGEGKEVYQPSFTYFGFRFAEVFGINNEQATVGLLTYILMSSKLGKAGSFSCSNSTVNRIQEATLRSDISNFYYFPTDCPHREKNGWTGDVALSCEQLMLNFEASTSLKEWQRCVCKAQNKEGALPGIVPTGDWGYSVVNGPAWDMAMFEIPFRLYQMQGDIECFLESEYAIARYLEYIKTKINEDGLVAYGLYDWSYVYETIPSPLLTPKEVSDSLTIMRIYEIAGILYDAVGEKVKAQECAKMREQFKIAFRKKYIDVEEKAVIPSSQTGQAMAIFYGAFEKEEIPKALLQLKKLIVDKNGSFDCGVLGLRVIFRVLSLYGESELAYKMITKPDFPSYATYATSEYGTLFEHCWKCHSEKGSILGYYKNENGNISGYSLNHHYRGDVSGWFYTVLGGIILNPTLKDYSSVEIEPCFISDLQWVKATHVFKGYGTLKVQWKRLSKKIEVRIFVPKGINAIWRFTGEKLKEGKNKMYVPC